MPFFPFSAEKSKRDLLHAKQSTFVSSSRCATHFQSITKKPERSNANKIPPSEGICQDSRKPRSENQVRNTTPQSLFLPHRPQTSLRAHRPNTPSVPFLDKNRENACFGKQWMRQTGSDGIFACRPLEVVRINACFSEKDMLY